MSRKLTISEIKERFNSKIIKTVTGCWEWQGYRWLNYGRCNLLGEKLTHRVSFMIHLGPIPTNAFVCHKCDNPPCINPNHLFLGNNQDNMRDCSSKGRCKNHNSYKTHCQKGHKFTEMSTYINPKNQRICKVCKKNESSVNYHKNIELSRFKQREYRKNKKLKSGKK